MTERVDCAYWVTIAMVWWYVALLLDGGFDGADGGADDSVSGGVSVEVGGFGLVRCWYQGGHLLEDQPRRWMSCRTGRQVTRHFTPVHSPFYISLFNIMKAAPVQTLPIWLLTQARSIHWPEDCLHLPRLLLSPHRALCRRGDEGSSRSESVSWLNDRPLQRILIDYEIVLFWFGLQKVHRTLKPFIFSVLPILRWATILESSAQCSAIQADPFIGDRLRTLTSFAQVPRICTCTKRGMLWLCVSSHIGFLSRASASVSCCVEHNEIGPQCN